MRHLCHLAFAGFSAAFVAACFSAVPEAPCTADADCPSGKRCNGSACVADTTDGGAGGGAGGGATGGGTGGATGSDAGEGDDAGAAGGAGGGASGGGAPDAGVCGCVSVLGCQPGDSPLACGNGGMGTTCATCGFGEQCINGACVMAPCGPQSCAGCCANNFCVTPSQQNRFACGTRGAACTSCDPGQLCQNGACVVPMCDATTCPSGCCQNGQCQPGTQVRACGTGGAPCQPCGMGNRCVAGVCLTPDGGAVMPVPTGSACTSSGQCQPPGGAFCIPESFFGQPTGFTGGSCSAQCSATQPCTSGVCITEPVAGFSGSTCRATCPAPGTGQSTCRAGYVCAANGTTGTGYCRPNCNNPSALGSCPAGQTCNVTTGYCQ